MPRPHDSWNALVDRRAVPPQPLSGALAGVRLAVKDNIAVAGLKWTAGLPLLADRIADRTAPCVAALEAAGATVIGMAATDAAGFGMMTPGVVNPLDPMRSAGGSSGGSAAAVAAGLADLALGTDTAGSVRVPAACCGLYGLKPSRGRVSTEGVTPLSTSFDHVGLIAADLALLSRATAVLLAAPPAATPSRPFVIGHDPARLVSAEQPIAAAICAVLARLAAEGHTLREVRLPDRDALADAHGIVVCHEALAAWTPQFPAKAALFGDTARRSLAYAQSVGDQHIAWGSNVIAETRTSLARIMAEVDIVLGPTMLVAPPPKGARKVTLAGSDVAVVRALLAETCPWNVSGHPALALPLPLRIGRIPVSLQIAGRDDMGLLAIAQALAPVLASIPGSEPA